MRLFIDTWGWLALAEPKRPEHRAAARCYEERGGPPGIFVTSTFVLDETFTHLFNRRPFDLAWRYAAALVNSPFIAVEPVTDARFRRALELRRKFADKPRISFTDLTSMALMQELKLTDVLTADRHFSHVGLGFRILPE